MAMIRSEHIPIKNRAQFEELVLMNLPRHTALKFRGHSRSHVKNGPVRMTTLGREARGCRYGSKMAEDRRVYICLFNSLEGNSWNTNYAHFPLSYTIENTIFTYRRNRWPFATGCKIIFQPLSTYLGAHVPHIGHTFIVDIEPDTRPKYTGRAWV